MPELHMKSINRRCVCVIVANSVSQYNYIMDVVILVIDIIIYNQTYYEFLC